MFRDDAVAGSWAGLVARLDAAGAVRRWARVEPVLVGLGSVTALVAQLARGADPARSDAVLGAVVRRAHRDGGDELDAVLLVLQLLSGGLVAMVEKFRALGVQADLGTAVAEMTCRIRAYPSERTRAYAANLLRDTGKALLRQGTTMHRAVGELPVDPHSPLLTGRPAPPDMDDPDPDPQTELRRLLDWAIRTGVTASDDVDLLLTNERLPPGPDRRALATRIGMHERALRRRRNRTVTALRRACDEYLHQCA